MTFKRFVGTTLAGTLIAMLLVGMAPVAHAAPGDNFEVGLTQKTGTAPFNTTDGGGYDSSETNTTVRTNDFITYSVSIASQQGLATAPRITLNIPQGQEMKSVPQYCLAGSSLTPQTLPDPVLPVTSTSYQTLGTQILVCVVADVAVGNARTFDIVTRVRPEMPDSHNMGNVTVTVTTTNPDMAPQTSDPVHQIVSAGAKWDLSINGAEATNNTAFVKQETVQKCTVPALAGKWCFVGGYPVTLSIPDGGKGGTPVTNGEFTFQLNVDPGTIWGDGALAAADWGGYLDVVQNDPYGSPGSYMNAAGVNPGGTPHNTDNSVRNSGTSTITQPGGPGTPILIHVTGVDTTAYTVPTDAFEPDKYKVRTDRGYVWTKRIFVQIPVEQFMATGDNGALDLDATVGALRGRVRVEANELPVDLPGTAYDTSGLAFTDIYAATTNKFSDPNGTANNYRQSAAVIQSLLVASNDWISPVGYPTATPPSVYSPGYAVWYGPTGDAGRSTGDGVAVPGQTVLSSIHMSGNNAGGVTMLACQTFDNTKVQIAPGTYPEGFGMQRMTSTQYAPYTDTDTGGATWISGSMYNFNDPQQLATKAGQFGMVDRYGEFRVQYGSGPAGDTNCAGDITWSDTPTASTNHVRVFVQAKAGLNAQFQRTNISIAFKVIATDLGTHIPTWVSYTQQPGAASFDTMTAAGRTWSYSGYDPAVNADDNGVQDSRRGDRLTLVKYETRVTKEVLDPKTNTYVGTDAWVPSQERFVSTSNSLPTFGPGSTVTYRMNPYLVSAVPVPVPQGQLAVLEDCLPANLVYAGANIPPDRTDPAHAVQYTPQITCDPGEQYLAWIFTPTVPNVPGPVITVQARVLETAPSGIRLNEAQVQIPGDSSREELRQAKVRIAVEAPAGVSLSKASLNRFVQVDDNGWVSSPTVRWQIVVRAVDNPNPLSDIDIIDLLPANGINASKFSGDGDFIRAEVSGDPTVRIWYTKSPVGATPIASWIDPRNTVNSAGGSTVWCDAPSGGAVMSGAGDASACPAAPGEVTGLRIQRPGEFPSSAEFMVDVYNNAQGNLPPTLDPVVRAEGEHMYNRIMMQATGLSVPLTSSARTDFVSVPELQNGRITGFVWHDVNADGIWTDPIRFGAQATEPPIEGAIVHLTGTDARGNAISLQTTTSATGFYGFGALVTGNYTLRFETPAGMTPTKTGADSVGTTTTVALSGQLQFADNINSGFRIPGALAVTKSVTADDQQITGPVPAGTTLTYKVTLTNTSEGPFPDYAPVSLVDDLSGVLDDGALVGTPTASGGTVKIVADSKLVWTGPLAADGSVTITYQVQVHSTGDRLAENVAFGTDAPVNPDTDLPTDPDTGEPVTPPADCPAPTCASTETRIMTAPSLTITKTSGPSAQVGIGGVVTYTVKVSNTGEQGFEITNPAGMVDDLSDVLDDGTYNGDAKATAGTITLVGTNLVWTGVLAGGTSATITYSITATGAGDRVARNIAFVTDDPTNPGTTPEGCPAPTCATTTTSIVTVPTPAANVTKQVSSQTVRAGEELTYTVKITNVGKGAYTTANPATLIDDLYGVLDDGTFNNDLSATTGTATKVGDRIVWTGALQPGATATITYSITTTGKGDKQSVNVAFVTGDPIDPATGLPTNPKTGQVSESPVGCPAPTCASTTSRITGALAQTGLTTPGLVALLGVLFLAGGGALLVLRQRRRG